MREFELTRAFLGKEIIAKVYSYGKDGGIHISLYGGDRPHIGAISIYTGNGNCKTERFPGHREDIISERWATALGRDGWMPVVVEAGIHYDNLDKGGIKTVLELAEELLMDVLSEMHRENDSVPRIQLQNGY